MAQLAFTGKERIGRVTIERFKDYIRLRWTYKGKTHCITIGSDCRASIQAARAKAGRINDDLTFDRFDSTLAAYKAEKSPALSIVNKSSPVTHTSIREIWNLFLDDKLPQCKQKTQDEYRNFTRIFDKVGKSLSIDPIATKKALLDCTTQDQARRSLQYLSAACKWGIKRQLIQFDPFDGLAAEMPKRKSYTDPQPDAFTDDERDRVIEAFKTDTRPGINYRHYAPIVEFWFFTGCRPSEAIGLKWNCVSDDCSKITFIGSIQTVRGRQVWVEGSKNNKTRTIAVSRKVQSLLLSIKPEIDNPDSYVFPSPKGKAINYPNFLSKIWGKIVDPIKPNTTPYNCRDTFITNQLLNGVATSVIAKWCDTSTQMIDKNYADKLKLSQLRPVD
ncbi:tyrosine-type recombinase/integrase [Gloeocapsopsis sp. IPPAS B-1203]|uniref:tyrosine-type recombinase/integrase n=1 Tax=Gloeocapsopsis sp. IPPAS B-1203 TaxID=2049454 RepID=UPI000C18EA67|nr:tyrosine-type recombinase/integrase [Gloeocapsopsis sp. IPPAS B-1203]PIG90809.1 integrase [Gloeocapsopsis sp. IPPAS B-1203]